MRPSRPAGFPQRAWFDYKTLGLGALPIFLPMIVERDPEYFEDFWKVPGYAGADPPEQSSQLRLMVGGDQLTSSSTLGFVVPTRTGAGGCHGPKLQLVHRTRPGLPGLVPRGVEAGERLALRDPTLKE